jgi:hypothetical protein
MGSKKTKTTQTNKPIYSAEIGGAANNIANAYTGSAGAARDVSSNLGQVSSDLFAQYRQGGDPTVSAASSYLRSQLQGDPTQNPYLQQQIDLTNESVRNQAQASLGRRGLTGGSDYTNLITRALAQNESGVRYQDYNNAENRRLQAAGLAPSIAQAGYLPLQQATQAGLQGALLPSQLAAIQGAGIGGLLGQYQDVRGTQKQSGISFGEISGLGLNAASLFSDARLKTDIRRVGQTDAGTPIYTYRYLGEGPYHMGVMADDVPHAQGPVVEGFKTVCYEAVA